MNQDEFKEPIKVFFDEWKPNWNWIKIKLYRFQEAKEEVIKNTHYWVFNGVVIQDKSPLRIVNKAECIFYFSKVMFKREIQRHLHMMTLHWEITFDLELEIKRPSKYSLVMKNVNRISSD